MDSKRRSWAKSMTWRAIGVVILGLITYLITSDWKTMTGVTVLFHSIRVILYYWHERLWERIGWGKLNHPLERFAVKENLTPEDYEAIGLFLQDQKYTAEAPEYQI